MMQNGCQNCGKISNKKAKCEQSSVVWTGLQLAFYSQADQIWGHPWKAANRDVSLITGLKQIKEAVHRHQVVAVIHS